MKIRSLSKVLQEIAENELKEVPNQLEENLEMLKSWLCKQKHLKYKDDDQLLVTFLRASKFSIERTKEKLDAYYTFRTLAPEIAPGGDILSPLMQRALQLGMMCPLFYPEDDSPSSAVILIRHTEKYDPEDITPTLMTKLLFQTVEIVVNKSDAIVINGVKAIWDLKGLHLKTALQITPTLIKKGIYGMEKAYPIRLKEVLIINVPTYYEKIVKLITRLVPKKLVGRILIFSTEDNEELQTYIPKNILPSEYGGDAGPAHELAMKWRETIDSYREDLLKDTDYCSDETKRSGCSSTLESLFGVDGSFRKLDID